jgi:hypothetical protein
MRYHHVVDFNRCHASVNLLPRTEVWFQNDLPELGNCYCGPSVNDIARAKNVLIM